MKVHATYIIYMYTSIYIHTYRQTDRQTYNGETLPVVETERGPFVIAATIGEQRAEMAM